MDLNVPVLPMHLKNGSGAECCRHAFPDETVSVFLMPLAKLLETVMVLPISELIAIDSMHFQ